MTGGSWMEVAHMHSALCHGMVVISEFYDSLCVCMHCPTTGSSKCPRCARMLLRPLGWACDRLLLGQMPGRDRYQPGI